MSRGSSLIERWFGELTPQKLASWPHSAFRQLETEFRGWIQRWKENLPPQVWTKPAEQSVESTSRCERINLNGT